MLHFEDIAKKQWNIEKNAESTGGLTVVFDNLEKTCLFEQNNKLLKYSQNDFVPVIGDAEETRFARLEMGQQVFDTNGKFLGCVTDAIFTSALVLRNIFTETATVPKRKILSVGDAIIVKEKSAKQLFQEKARKKMCQNITHKAITSVESSATVSKAVVASSQTQQIQRRYGNFGFLIGKTVNKTVVNFQGEVMVKAGEAITKDILRQAKISGKLIELCLHLE